MLVKNYYYLFLSFKKVNMKINKDTIWSFVLLVVIAAVYRIIPGRPGGFAPQIAMALFAGSVIADKKMSFLLPLLSMFVSDALFELLYINGLTAFQGFYDGQITNYVLFAGLTVIGFWVKKNNIAHIIGGSLAAATIYFIASNLLLWIAGGLGINNLPYAKNWAGLMECFTVAVPFYLKSIYATLTFSAVLFGAYYLLNKYAFNKVVA
jgi:hypothetical protein